MRQARSSFAGPWFVILASLGMALPNPALAGAGGTEVTRKVAALAQRFAESFAKLEEASRFKRVAVMPFDDLSPEAKKKSMGAVVTELLAGRLTKQPGFVVIERSRLKDIIQELGLQETSMVDESTAQELGKIAGAQAIITGSVTAAGPAFVVAARQISVETAQVVLAEEINIERAGLIALSDKSVVIKSKEGALFRSLVAPGFGQLYNEQRIKGYIFMGTEVAVITAAIIRWRQGVGSEDAYLDAESTVDAEKYRSRANNQFRDANILLWMAAGVWAANALDAYLNGRSVSEVRLPEELTGGAQVEVTPEGGARLAYSWRF